MRLVILDSSLESTTLMNSFNSKTEVFVVNSSKTKLNELLTFIKNKEYNSVAYMAHYQKPNKHFITSDLKLDLTKSSDKTKLVDFWKHFNTHVIDYLGCALIT